MKNQKLRKNRVCHEIASLDDLKKKNERIKMKDAMIKETKQKNIPSIDLQFTFLRLPLVPGSEKSKMLLSTLDSLGDSEVFETHLIRNMLDYKWEKVRWLGYLFTILYFTYLIMAVYSDDWEVVLGWLIYFVLIEAYQLKTSGDESEGYWQSFI